MPEAPEASRSAFNPGAEASTERSHLPGRADRTARRLVTGTPENTEGFRSTVPEQDESPAEVPDSAAETVPFRLAFGAGE